LYEKDEKKKNLGKIPWAGKKEESSRSSPEGRGYALITKEQCAKSGRSLLEQGTGGKGGDKSLPELKGKKKKTFFPQKKSVI